MSLESTLLGLLKRRPRTGYDLRQDRCKNHGLLLECHLHPGISKPEKNGRKRLGES